MGTLQLALLVASIAAFAVAVLLLVWAAHTYVSQDIRGVMNDLSGKSRQGNRASGSARRRRQGVQRHTLHGGVSVDSAAGLVDAAVQGVAHAPGPVSEDDLDTVLDTKLRKLPQEYVQVSSDMHDVNDDMPTLVTSIPDYHQNDAADANVGDADDPTYVGQDSDDVPTEVEGTTSSDAHPFVITQSILAIHSSEIITAE